MAGPKVLISILNWNAPANTIAVTKSVLDSNYKDYTILIIDNNSIDQSTSEIRDAFPSIHLMSLSKNIGYAAAHKKAAMMAKKENYDMLWLLNNDVKVFPNTLGELVKAYNRTPNSILGSIAVDKDGETIQFAGGTEIDAHNNEDKAHYNFFAGNRLSETNMKERPVSDLGGASILLPVALIKKYGFIDTKYFLYGEETDYSYYLRRNFGIPSIIVPTSVIIHAGGASFNTSPRLEYIRTYYRSRNIYYIYKKYFKDYEFRDVLQLRDLVKFFIRHFVKNFLHEKNNDYWLRYYRNLGHFHGKIKLMGKFFDPNDFIGNKNPY